MNKKATVLLIEDNENDVMLMKSAMDKAHFSYEVKVVGDGEEAIEYLQGEEQYINRQKYPLPLAMILDLKMPRKGGLEVMAWKQNQPELSHIPVFVLTSSSRLQDVERAFELGAHAFLIKPPSIEKLTEMMGTLNGWLKMNHFPVHPLGVEGAVTK